MGLQKKISDLITVIDFDWKTALLDDAGFMIIKGACEVLVRPIKILTLTKKH